MTARIFLKLIIAVACLLTISLVAVDYVGSQMVERLYLETLTRQLVEKARLVAESSSAGPERFNALAKASGGRITVVNRAGVVLADSEFNASRMENHANRPEIAAALAGRIGTEKHFSKTIGVDFYYVAVPSAEGAVRVAVPLARLQSEIRASRLQLISTTGLAFLPAALLAAWFARYASSRLGSIIDYAGQLAQGNFRARLSAGGGDEFGVLSSKLNDTGEKLQQMFSQLEHEQQELEKLERIRKDFVINVSHELRTPLASIQGYAETLLDGALSDPQHNVKFVEIIRQNAERLTRLTADLLSLSRVELGTQKFQFDAYYVNGLLENAILSLQPLADKKGVHLRLEPAGPRAEVFCDSEALHQILSNLIDNALKYTPEGGSVTLAAHQEGNSVKIDVRDTGVGIPEEDLPRLFERFYRVDKARSRELGGTGLGLAIVKHLTHAMGGDVSVTSQVNRGSTFSFTLPVGDLGLPQQGGFQPEFTAS